MSGATALYEESEQLGAIVKKYQMNYKFWELVYNELQQEKNHFVNDMLSFRIKEIQILRRMKRNRRQVNLLTKRRERLIRRHNKLFERGAYSER